MCNQCLKYRKQNILLRDEVTKLERKDFTFALVAFCIGLGIGLFHNQNDANQEPTPMDVLVGTIIEK